MSLDVYLSEYDRPCPHCKQTILGFDGVERYSANITHNLAAMAEEAGIYKHLWRPEELGITQASELIIPLRDAVVLMQEDPSRFRKHNSPNGWGIYENFVTFVASYANACAEYPDSYVRVSR